MQTLSTLNLGVTGIGTEGAKYLAQALQNNIVRKLIFSPPINSPLCSIQTLTTLDLYSNSILAEGAQHLTQALLNNRVTSVFF
jgi:hypothetical protein